MTKEEGLSQLTVYKASAGSGKTFTLAKEYMTLVIRDPMAYRTILAVTFTNKATEEMKMRILSKLYSISHRLPDAKDYLEQIEKTLSDMSEEQIIHNAGIALSNLIHNYNYFRVQTIDTFFQGVLRNLARELDLTANLRIWLNDDQVEQMAVDELIENLNDKDKLLFWILEYIKENIADDKGWNVIRQIKSFGLNIFKDYYKDHADELSQCLEKEGFFESFTTLMRKKKKEAEDGLQLIAATFFDALDANGLTADDFKLKTKGPWSYFNKLRNGKYEDDDLLTKTIMDCLDDPKNWVNTANAHFGNPAYDLAVSQLDLLLRDAERKYRPKFLRVLKSADLTMRHMNQLRLLSSIDQKVREMNKDANRFLLSDTQTLLHSLIQNDDSPFIFEKIGTQLDHVMIDEFQDTSTVQWQNFKVLLLETMSREDAGNLIVGDVKQSIYRWRSGDWRLLNNIDTEFPSTYKVTPKPLDTNYRSDRSIIEFNNAFFNVANQKEIKNILKGVKSEKQALEAEEDNPVKKDLIDFMEMETKQLEKAYEDVSQKVPEHKAPRGFVRIHLLPKDSAFYEDKEDYEQMMLRMTLETIQELVEEKGVPFSKIAILVRSNKTIQKVADYLMNNSQYPLVSDEAFRLDASQAVNFLVATLYHLSHPDDKIVVATIKNDVAKYHLSNEATEQFFSQRELLLQEPLYDLVEKIFHLFGLGENDIMKAQSAYVCAFFDQLSNYLSDNGSDIDGFLEEWESNIHSKSIHSDKVDGIQLISIHKSKGLEFDNVIMPFTEWKMEMGGTIWCNPTEEPYSRLPLVPVDFMAKKMMGSIYEKDYLHEHLQNMVDNLNLLYVAFTRAGRNLFIYGKRESEAYRTNIIEDSLTAVNNKLAEINSQRGDNAQPQSLQGIAETTSVDQDEKKSKGKGKKKEKDNKSEEIIFEYGSIDNGKLDESSQQLKSEEDKDKKNKNTDKNGRFRQGKNVFDTKPESISLNIKTLPDFNQFRPSQKSLDFINGEDEEDAQQQYYIKMGTVLHNLFSTIRTKDDIEKALRQLELDGVLYDENVSKSQIENMLRKRLNSTLVSDWFSDRWKVMNECNLLYFKDGKVANERPDRVLLSPDGDEIIVIDFKFGKPQPEHQQQVNRYMNALKKMGYSNIKGFLWYVYPNKVAEVAYIPSKQ